MEAIKITDFKAFRGRNVYSHTPVFRLNINIGKYCDVPTNAIKGFNERLLSVFPGLTTHTCCSGKVGGFVERLKEGTYLGHIAEHVIIDLQNQIGFNVKYGKTISDNKNPDCTLFIEYIDEECALKCCYGAIDLLNNLIVGNNADKKAVISEIEATKERVLPGPSTMALIAEAKRRFIPVKRIGSGNLIWLGYGNKSRLLQATLSDSASCIATDICSDKQLTKEILSQYYIPVPKGEIVKNAEDALYAAKRVGFPVVVKPLEANQGKGVSANLKNEREITHAFDYASKYGRYVIVESYIKGKDYRVLVVKDKVSAVSMRLAPSVRGDGIHTLKELIDILNSDEKRGNGHEKPLTKVKIDDSVLSLLKRKGLNLDYIPSKNKMIILRENGNLSTGGTAVDCTDIIHAENAAIAVRCVKALGMDIAGVDMIAKDIAKPIVSNGGAVIEVNAAPGIRMHLYPAKGKARSVAKDIIDSIFPTVNDADFPIVSVTGTNGKTTTVRLIAHILSLTGKKVGMTCTSGTYIDGKCIREGDNSGYLSAQDVLYDRSVEAAVLETARGSIIKKGLGYDLANVGIITNITEDHLNLDGVNTLDDLANVKSLVVEAIKPNGYAVLNAEDEMTNSIIKNVTAQIIFFYLDKNNVKVDLKQARKLVYAENGFIKIYDDGYVFEIESINAIPLTFMGVSECNIKNCLAATAAAFALGIPSEKISEGMRTFSVNCGRFEIYEMTNFNIMLDYGHNIDAYTEVSKFCKKITHKRLIGIIGVPGDRTDSSVKKVGQISAKCFDKIYIKEDEDLRNRAKFEIADILYNTVVSEGHTDASILADEVSALEDAIKKAKQGDFIVVFYEKYQPLVELIEKHQGKKLDFIQQLFN